MSLSQLLTGAGMAGANPYAMAGGIGLRLLEHELQRPERRRQQRLQQEMARWTPYNSALAGGLKQAMQPRHSAATAGLQGALGGQKEWAQFLNKQEEAKNDVATQTARNVASEPQYGNLDPGTAASMGLVGGMGRRPQSMGPISSAVRNSWGY